MVLAVERSNLRYFNFYSFLLEKHYMHEIEIKLERKSQVHDNYLTNEHAIHEALKHTNSNQPFGMPTILGMGYQSGNFYTITQLDHGMPLREFVNHQFFPNSMVLRFAVEVVCDDFMCVLDMH